MGGIALIVDHHDLKLPEGNFPAKPFFGVEPVIIDPKLVCDRGYFMVYLAIISITEGKD